MIFLTLPWCPSTNVYYRKFRNRIVISKAGEMYKSKVRAKWYASGLEQIRGPVWISAVLVQPTRAVRDLDNFSGKALLDALKGLAFEDDCWVWRLHAEWARNPDGTLMFLKGGEMSIAIRSIAPKELVPVQLDCQ